VVQGSDLTPLQWQSPTASAQVKSAILLAGLVAQVPVSVTEPQRSRDHTERMLSALGAEVLIDGTTVSLPIVRSLAPIDVDVPADPSSAAFFAALAAVASGGELRLPGVCLNPTRLGFFDALQRIGAVVKYENVGEQAGEPVGTIVVTPAVLRGVDIGEAEVPSLVDELPMLACLASQATGETHITGAGELRVKESDRIATVVNNLRSIGADAEELPDGMRIVGTPGRPLRGRIITHGDHRIAMAFGILGASGNHDIVVDDQDCVAVSFPDFWSALHAAVA